MDSHTDKEKGRQILKIPETYLSRSVNKGLNNVTGWGEVTISK